MLVRLGDRGPSAQLTLVEICHLVEQKHQPAIQASCLHISDYLLVNPHIQDLPVSVSELVHLVYSKLQDEVKHLFLKESGIVFPSLTQSLNKDAVSCLQQNVLDKIFGTHQVIIQLLQKLRQLLHNYVTQPGWDKQWIDCVNEMYALETKVHRWIQFEQSELYVNTSHTSI